MSATAAVEVAFGEVIRELTAAMQTYPAMASAHEGYAVILEEVDELWEEVRKRPDRRLGRAMRDEARQIAAMAIRFMVDICAVVPPDSAKSVVDDREISGAV